jgi:hypothetical protein
LPQAELNKIWDGLAQGHESKDLRLDTAVPLMRPLGLSYVRIDHVLNGFDVISRNSEGKLAYDWTKLDLLIGDIQAMGATPFFAVSYMPPAISRGDIIDLPRDWGEYGQVVSALVGRYSRDYKGGLSNVVYEIWNEPDLFGGFKTYGEKNYLTLYRTAANAAVSVRGAKPFLLGGPSTTGFYPAWANDFYTKLPGVRKDFFSWHRYSYKVSDFVKDAEDASRVIAPLTTTSQKLFVTEWGIDSERGKIYDGQMAGAHFMAVSRALVDTNVDLAMAFEVQDGTTGEEKLHGGWGMVTNPKYGEVVAKPRYRAMALMQRLSGVRLPIAGEGSFVTALGAQDRAGVMRIMVVNYDPRGRHRELVPITFAGMQPGSYSYSEEYLSGRRVSSTETVLEGDTLAKEVVLPASEAVLVTVTRVE